MARPELVLFDLDGTLLDGAGLPAAMRRTAEVLAERMPGTTADEVVAANTAAWQRLWPEAEDDWLLGGRTGDAVAEDAWRATLAGAGAEDEALLGLALRTWDREQREAFRLYDDVLPALAGLEDAAVRLGLLTNGAGSVQRLKLETTGLADRFDPVVVSGEAGVRKPDPAVFGLALERAGVPADRAWYVGDNLWHDVAPAREAGLHAVWVDRHGVALQADWPRPDAVLPTLEGLPALVRQAGWRDPASGRGGREPRGAPPPPPLA